VWVSGHDLGDSRTDLRQVRRMVGLVFQRPEDQLFEAYVGDDVAYGPRQGGLHRAELRERVQWAMGLVGLDFERYKDRLTATLSGGERRKAGLAGVLALRPTVLLLDEPTAGLDPAARGDLLANLSALRRQGMTMPSPRTHGRRCCTGGCSVCIGGGEDRAAGRPTRGVCPGWSIGGAGAICAVGRVSDGPPFAPGVWPCPWTF